MPKQHHTIKDIDIEIGDPSSYLLALWAAINKAYPEFQDVMIEIEDALGYGSKGGKSAIMNVVNKTAIKPKTVGYDEPPLLISIADREWIDSEYNEFSKLASYLDSTPLFSSTDTVYICGAGVCRMGDYISSLENIKSVYCTDLSWLALYLGRMFIRQEYHKLPALFRLDRLFYDVVSGANEVSARMLPPKFRPSGSSARNKIRYGVKDAFAMINPAPAKVICVPYLLDLFMGEQLRTLLIRICQWLEIGQELVIITTLLFRPAEERNPQDIVQVMKACGFEVDYLDITQLPYSFSYDNYGVRKEIWNTLILKAVKRKQTPLSNLILLTDANGLGRIDAGASFGDDVQITWQGNKMSLRSNYFQVFQKCLACTDYSALREMFIGRMSTEEFECAVGALASQSLLNLRAKPG